MASGAIGLFVLLLVLSMRHLFVMFDSRLSLFLCGSSSCADLVVVVLVSLVYGLC